MRGAMSPQSYIGINYVTISTVQHTRTQNRRLAVSTLPMKNMLVAYYLFMWISTENSSAFGTQHTQNTAVSHVDVTSCHISLLDEIDSFDSVESFNQFNALVCACNWIWRGKMQLTQFYVWLAAKKQNKNRSTKPNEKCFQKQNSTRTLFCFASFALIHLTQREKK